MLSPCACALSFARRAPRAGGPCLARRPSSVRCSPAAPLPTTRCAPPHARDAESSGTRVLCSNRAHIALLTLHAARPGQAPRVALVAAREQRARPRRRCRRPDARRPTRATRSDSELRTLCSRRAHVLTVVPVAYIARARGKLYSDIRHNHTFNIHIAFQTQMGRSEVFLRLSSHRKVPPLFIPFLTHTVYPSIQ